MSSHPLKVAFLHPDLGIGGAERLVVDAALSLQSEQSNEVTIYTSHCDKNHCFEEVANGQLAVEVHGDFLPTNFLGRFAIVFAFLRQFYLTLVLILTGSLRKYDVIVLDQLPYCIPLIHLLKRKNAKVLFYCHFPDKLLAPHSSLLLKAYRYAFDALEEFSTSCADSIVVNSQFTKTVVRKTFTSLDTRELNVIYPCVSMDTSIPVASLTEISSFFKNSSFFLSINRFERKKNIELAIKSYAEYVARTGNLSQKLVIAGGYDARVFENVSYLIELEKLCEKLKLPSLTIRGRLLVSPNSIQVFFLPSVSSNTKNALLAKCDMLLYTPSYEHFGIVPLEAMRLGKIVLADNTGGPLETIRGYYEYPEEYTGFTVPSDEKKWCDVLEKVKKMGSDEREFVSERAKERVRLMYSFESLTRELGKVVGAMEGRKWRYEGVVWVVLLVPVVVGVLMTSL